MFFSSGCITLLLYGLQACLAAIAVPSPISMSDTSLAADLLQLPVTCSNDNGTHEQESVQLLCNNYTLATNNASNFAFEYPVANTPYQLRVTTAGLRLPQEPLLQLYKTAHRSLQVKVNKGQGADIPPYFHSKDPLGYLSLDWSNDCRGQYGSLNDLIPIMEALKNVTTVPGIMPPQHQNTKCFYNVFRDMGPGAENLTVGNGVVGETHVGNEAE